MARFSVEYSDRFLRDLEIIAVDSERWGREATQAYVQRILDRCEALDEMPHRFARFCTDQPTTYRSFTPGGHRVFYQVFDETRRVLLVRCVRGERDLDRLLYT